MSLSRFAFDDNGEPRSAEEIARLEAEENDRLAALDAFNEEHAREERERERSRQREKQPTKGKGGNYLPDIHRLLPQSGDAEQGVLSSVLLSPREVYAVAEEKGIEPAWFHVPAHQTLWEQISGMIDEGLPVDAITLTDRLRSKGLLERVGGPAFVMDVFGFLPTAANAGYYLEITEEKWTLREVIRICTELAGRAYDEQDNVAGLLGELEVAVSQLALRRYRKRAGTIKETVARVFDKCIAGKTEEAWGLSTGFLNLDAVMRGLRPGNLIAIGGETSAGKTSLALNMVWNLAVKRGIPCLIFSLEMTADEVTEVLIQCGSGVNVDEVAEKRVGDKELDAFRRAGEALMQAPITIRDEKDVSIIQARSIARTVKPRIIVADYAQLFTGGQKRYERADLEIADISRNSKKMAGELDATVLLLTQLNEDGKVSGSRTISKDADQLLIVKDGAPGEKIVQICKQRRGRKDEVHFRFIGPAQKFLPKALT